MGVTTSKLDLNEFDDITKIGDIGRFLFVGPRIQDALWQFLYHKRDIRQITVFTNSDYESRYREIVPSSNVNTEYGSSKIHQIIRQQMKKNSTPLIVLLHNDEKTLALSKLYRNDRNMRQLFDYADRLKICLIVTSNEPVFIPLKTPKRPNSANDDDNKIACFDYIFASESCEVEKDSDANIKYVRRVYKYYFKRLLPDDKEVFFETFNHYTSNDNVLILQQDCEMFYYTPETIIEPFVISPVADSSS